MTLRAFQLGLLALVVIFTACYALLMPSLTRRDILFGVTVAPDARSSRAGRRIIAGYRAGVIIMTLAALGLAAAVYALAQDDVIASPWFSISYIALVAVLGLPYLAAHAASRHLAAPSGEASWAASAPAAELRPRRYGDDVPWIWELLPLALIAATVAYLAPRYAAAPDVIAVHFDINGNPNGFAQKSIGSYFGLVWTQIFLELFLTLVGVLVARAKAVPGRADARFRRTYLRALFGLKTVIIAFMGVLAALIAAGASGATIPAGIVLLPTVVLLLVVFGGVLFLAIRTGQGGSRLGSPAETATDRTDDRYWILGVIYANRDDPAIFVERRFGIGWTINMANPRALGVLLAILALPAAFALILATVVRP